MKRLNEVSNGPSHIPSTASRCKGGPKASKGLPQINLAGLAQVAFELLSSLKTYGFDLKLKDISLLG